MDLTLPILGALAVWRVTHLLHAEAGPGRAFERLRGSAGVGPLGRALRCFHCLSLWLAIPAALLLASHWREFALLWLGMSAVAVLLERVTLRASKSAPTGEAALLPDSDFPTLMPLEPESMSPTSR